MVGEEGEGEEEGKGEPDGEGDEDCVGEAGGGEGGGEGGVWALGGGLGCTVRVWSCEEGEGRETYEAFWAVCAEHDAVCCVVVMLTRCIVLYDFNVGN